MFSYTTGIRYVLCNPIVSQSHKVTNLNNVGECLVTFLQFTIKFLSVLMFLRCGNRDQIHYQLRATVIYLGNVPTWQKKQNRNLLQLAASKNAITRKCLSKDFFNKLWMDRINSRILHYGTVFYRSVACLRTFSMRHVKNIGKHWIVIIQCFFLLCI